MPDQLCERVLERLTLRRCRTLLSLLEALCGCLSAHLGFARAYLLLLPVEEVNLAFELLLLRINEFVNAHGMVLSVVAVCSAHVFILWDRGWWMFADRWHPDLHV